MLLLTLCSYLMFGIQFVNETIRCRRYWSIMQRLFQNASVVVQRTRRGLSSNRSRTSLLNLAESSENVEFEDDHIQISCVQPVQEIDLSLWTAYTPYLETHNAVAEPGQNICVLLESRRPRELTKFVNTSLRIAPANRVHVLSLGRPVAWKTAEPFGIILQCSFAGLVSLSDAFGQGRLTLDEDLELTSFATVKARGSPQLLMPSAGSMFSLGGGAALPQEDSFYRRDEIIIGRDSFQLNTDTHSAQMEISSQGIQSTGYYTSKKGFSSVDKHQQPGNSSNNNREVDHTETFVVQQPPQIKAEMCTTPTDQTPSPSDTKIEHLLDNHNNSYNDSSVIPLDITEQTSQTPSPSGNKVEHSLDNNSHNDSGAVPLNIADQTFTKQTPQAPADQESKSESSLHKNGNGRDITRMKPPNILVYCGIKDSARIFAQVQSTLEACINTEAYTIYHLKPESIFSTPWQNNAALLVISSSTRLKPEAETEIENFVVKDRGIIVCFNSSVDSAFSEKLEDDGEDRERLVSFKFKGDQSITSVRGRFVYCGLKENCEVMVPYDSSSQDKALVVKINCEDGGVAVLSQLYLERDPTEFAKDADSFAALKQSNTDRLAVLRDILASLGIDTSSGATPTLTQCQMLAQRVGLKESFLESFKHRLKEKNLLKSQKMSLKFVHSADQTAASPTLLPVVTDVNSDARAEFFSPQAYWKNLGTLKLGQILFYTDVITSTMSVFDGLQFSVPESMGLIAVAGRQTSGRGRGGNSWLSPAGCAMFTLPLSVSAHSELGNRVSFLQHIVSVAVVQSVLTLPGYENLDIKLKWPNDIYYGKEMKLGGVLVTSTILDTTIYATIGCGFNVSNSNPTICINDIIRLRNISQPHLPELSPLTSSQLIARTVTCLENLLQGFEKDGYQAFCELYYKYWLHGDSTVRLQLEKDTEGVIVGLDDYGFLTVRTTDGLVSVQPDGNSFDMLHNLIHVKPSS